MQLQIKTLTPLWTGGVATGRMDRIHETGFIGSLRWWYEAIVRGLGGDVCDPTSDIPGDRCPRNSENYCQVCQLFGATGKRRQFRIRLGGGKALFEGNAHNILIPSGRIHQNNRAGGWYLMSESVTGADIPLSIIPLSTVNVSSHLRPVLSLIDRHAAIGAKVSNGYGVVHFYENGQAVQARTFSDLPRGSRPARQHTLPDIRDCFFAKIRFQTPTNNSNWWQNIKGIAEAWAGQVTDDGQTVNVYHRNQARGHLQSVVQDELLPLAPAVRNYLRFRWFPTLFRSDRTLERYLFGHTSQQENIASKINISHAYRLDDGNWEFRVWGWIPCRPPDGIRLNRDQFLCDLRATLTNAATWQWVFNGRSPIPYLVEWHSLDCDQQDGVVYLKELLGPNEGGAV